MSDMFYKIGIRQYRELKRKLEKLEDKTYEGINKKFKVYYDEYDNDGELLVYYKNIILLLNIESWKLSDLFLVAHKYDILGHFIVKNA